MQVFDASSMIYAWDNYPIKQFPGLWEWMAAKIKEQRLVMPTVAYEEVENKITECAKWLRDNELKRLETTNAILQDAMRIKSLIGVVGDKYHTNGVGENDLLIIATARAHQCELVSDEKRQVATPKEPTKRKIPSVCTMPEVSVPCINFLEYIKRSDATFR